MRTITAVAILYTLVILTTLATYEADALRHRQEITSLRSKFQRRNVNHLAKILRLVGGGGYSGGSYYNGGRGGYRGGGYRGNGYNRNGYNGNGYYDNDYNGGGYNGGLGGARGFPGLS